MDVRTELKGIFELVEAGRIDDAEERCRRSLGSDPDEINLLGMLGAILLKKGELDEAERHLTRTTELEPAFAKPWEDLGALWMARKEPDKAAPFFARARELNRAAARIDPRLERVDSLRKAGDTAAATQACQEILNREPDNPGALRQLAMIATDQEQYVIAEGYLRRIVTRLPGNAQAMLDLCRFLGDRGRYPEAIELLLHADRNVLEDPAAQRVLGDMLSVVGRSDEALQAYEKCLEAWPDDVSALLGRGHMLRIAGLGDDAADCYRRCVALQPDFGDAWWNLASFKGGELDDDDIRAMQTMAGSSATSANSAIGLRFALARTLEERREFDAAWEQYRIGNAAKRAFVKYDPVETEVSQRKIRETFDAAIFEGEMAETAADNTPIFIVGMPRSGSTLIEQIIASHSQVHGAGELPYIIMITKALHSTNATESRYPEIVREYDAKALTGLGRSYLHHALRHVDGDKPYFTDKMPANFQHAGFIRLILPQAKIIDVRRGPMATCVANFRQLFAQGKNQSYDLTELGEYYLLYVKLMAHWDDVMPGKNYDPHLDELREVLAPVL
jgi:tetratricopeptide (TPR) repeat protein